MHGGLQPGAGCIFVCWVLLALHGVGAQQCVDVALTSYAINGVRQTCDGLQPFCGDLGHGCGIAAQCASSCGACETTRYCDLAETGVLLHEEPATCDELTPFCNDVDFGYHIRIVCLALLAFLVLLAPHDI